MSNHLDWDDVRVRWTPKGFELTLPIVGKLTERFLLAITRQLVSYSLQGLWNDEADVSVSPLGEKIQITVNDLTEVDARALRQALDEGVSTAIDEVTAAIDREREPVQQWLNTLTAPVGQQGPTADYGDN